MTEDEYNLWLKIRNNEFIADQLDLLYDECTKAGIPIEDVKHYWYKSDKFSIFAKNKVKSYEQVRDEIVKDMNGHSPEYPTIKRQKSKDGHLLIVDPSDIHVGKLSVAVETGTEYNIDIATKRVSEGITELLNLSSGFEIDQILFVIGNDALHIDNAKRTTTAGTHQDTDGMWHTAFHSAKDMYVDAIERLMQIADVHVIYNPSNHDFTHGFFLADTLNSWFRLSDNVTFDSSIQHRKYYRYHENMIETDHGDGCKVNDTPMLMATEQPIMWSECKYRYSYKHHIHHKKHIGDSIGVNIQFLRTPSEPDGWHNRNGYINLPAIEAFVHSKEKGRVAQFTHYYG
jgi:hypothetical protein